MVTPKEKNQTQRKEPIYLILGPDGEDRVPLGIEPRIGSVIKYSMKMDPADYEIQGLVDSIIELGKQAEKKLNEWSDQEKKYKPT